MKNITITVMLLCGLLLGACKHKSKDIVADAKVERTRIDKQLNDYTLRQAEDVISKDKGALRGYFDGDQPKKVISQSFGERNRTFRNYYFAEGMLILVDEQVYVYNMPNTYTEDVARAQGDSVWYDDSKTVVEHNRYYLDDNRLVKWVGTDGADIAVNTTQFVKKQPELLANALYALKQLKGE